MSKQKYFKEQPGSLLIITRQLLSNSKLSYLEIFRQTDLHPQWLWSLKSGECSGPDVNRVQYLYEFLSGKKLDL